MHTCPTVVLVIAALFADPPQPALDPPVKPASVKTNTDGKPSGTNTAAKPPARLLNSTNAVSKARMSTNRPSLASGLEVPNRGRPRRLIGAGSRSSRNETITLIPLAPREVGSTVQEQPRLYFSIANVKDMKGVSRTNFVFSFIEPKNPKPILNDVPLGPQVRDGLNAIDLLSKKGVTLDPGIEYEWSVAYISNPRQRSKDIVAKGVIRRIVPDPRLQNEVQQLPWFEIPMAYSRSDIWYDAFDALQQAFEKDKTHPELVQARIALLREIGLEVDELE